MTRRDRAAMVYALECLRTPPKVTRVPMYALHALPEEIREAWEIARYEAGVPHRLLRARLALLLRVLLRVDKGDMGPVTWQPWPDADGTLVRGPACADDPCFDYVPITPLWDLAARGASR